MTNNLPRRLTSLQFSQMRLTLARTFMVTPGLRRIGYLSWSWLIPQVPGHLQTKRRSAIRQDVDSNERFYGKRFHTRDIVLDGKATQPDSTGAAATEWIEVVTKYAPSR